MNGDSNPRRLTKPPKRAYNLYVNQLCLNPMFTVTEVVSGKSHCIMMTNFCKFSLLHVIQEKHQKHLKHKTFLTTFEECDA